MRKFLYCVVGMLAMFSVSVAKADPISGQISFIGYDNYDLNSGQISFVGNGGLGATSGSFANSAFSQGCTNCATFTDFNYKNLVPNVVYSANLNGDVTSFTLNSVTSYTANSDYLFVSGLGSVRLNNDVTDGSFLFTSQAGGDSKVNVTFSATTVANSVPEPTSLLVMLAALIGVVGFTKVKRVVA